MIDLDRFIKNLPKAELHLHIEGTFEPGLMLKIAERNNCKLKQTNIEKLRAAYDFNDLQEFLDIYYQGAGILLTEQDFYDLTMAYLQKVSAEKVLHTEIFFDPQTHTGRGVAFETVVNGIYAALSDAKDKLNISCHLIMCFLRHLDEDSAMKTLRKAIPFRDKIIGVGLDSSELGNPPEKFKKVFDKARQSGFMTVAHAGEEGPASYVRGTLEYLKVNRIDHGNRSLEDPVLIAELVQKGIPLTICPLSNYKLKVVRRMKDHPLKELLEKGLIVTVNSDDPAYFGGYINDNYLAVCEALDLSKEQIAQLARNSFIASFISTEKKQAYMKQVEDYVSAFI
jgi:adenosine deaminase